MPLIWYCGNWMLSLYFYCMQLKKFFTILSIGGECYTFTNQAPKEMIQKTLEDPPEEFGNYLYSMLSKP